MRYLLILWFLPFSLFWGWYGLSANNIDFGSIFLTRDFHDHMFLIYGDMLGVAPDTVPGLIAGAFALDSLILMGVAAFAWRKSWVPVIKHWFDEQTEKRSLNSRAGELPVSDLAFTTGSVDPKRPAE